VLTAVLTADFQVQMFWLYDVIRDVLLQKFTKRPRLDLLLLQVSYMHIHRQR